MDSPVESSPLLAGYTPEEVLRLTALRRRILSGEVTEDPEIRSLIRRFLFVQYLIKHNKLTEEIQDGKDHD